MVLKRVKSSLFLEESFSASRAVRAGPLVFVSGTGAHDASGQLLYRGDAGKQAEVALLNLGTELTILGAGLDRVVRLGVQLTEATQAPAVAGVLSRAFEHHRPAMTITLVAGFLTSGQLVQLDATAVLRGPDEPEEEPAARVYVAQPRGPSVLDDLSALP